MRRDTDEALLFLLEIVGKAAPAGDLGDGLFQGRDDTALGVNGVHKLAGCPEGYRGGLGGGLSKISRHSLI